MTQKMDVPKLQFAFLTVVAITSLGIYLIVKGFRPSPVLSQTA